MFNQVLVIAFLIIFIVTQDTNILVSTVKTVQLIFPASKTVTVNTKLAVNPDYQGVGAQWVTNQGGLTQSGQNITFKTSLNSTCSNASAILSISTDNKFTAYLNGARIMVGYSISAYKIPIILKCGQNNLIVIVQSQNSTASVIFSINQSTPLCSSTCSTPYASFNSSNCQCQCTQNIPCPSNSNWIGYPQCECACPVNQTFNQTSFSCQCPSTQCSPGLFLNASNCQCESSSTALTPNSINDCKSLLCPSQFKWDQSTCSCIFSKFSCAPTACPANYDFNYSICACVCSSQSQTCVSPQVWLTASCSCGCATVLTCTGGTPYWDAPSCSCLASAP